jgi:hypothetical protein
MASTPTSTAEAAAAAGLPVLPSGSGYGRAAAGSACACQGPPRRGAALARRQCALVLASASAASELGRSGPPRPSRAPPHDSESGSDDRA